MRKVTAIVTAAAATFAMAALAAPAQAAEGTTTVALTVADGELAIVATAAATGVTSSLVGTSRVIVSPLGLTTIADTRAASTGWNLTASTTDFTRAAVGTVPAATISAAQASFYVDGAPTTTLGTASYTFTPSTAPSSSQLAKATATGVTTTTLTPVLKVAVPNSAGTGLYTGTVTQSVL